jgi:membrane protease subunit (stomatin/prohibitin family)
MAIIDVLKYDGPNNVLVWKWRSPKNSDREEELRWGTQVVVNESQEACFIKGGRLLDILPPGTHTLSTKNLPILSSIIGLAFGGDTPFKAEIYYINKIVSLDSKFGVLPFNLIEPNFRMPIPVTCRGSYAINVSDTKLFLSKIVGTVPEINTNTLTQFFRGVIVENVKENITNIAKSQNLSPLELESIAYEVSNEIREKFNLILNEYGINLRLFNIEAISVVEDDPKVKKVIEDFHRIMAEHTEEKMRFSRRSENIDVFKVERTFDTSEKIAENMGGGLGEGGNLMGTMIGMGMVNPLVNQMGGLLNNNQMINPPADLEKSNRDNNKVFEDLEKLGSLREKGILTEDEFTEKKKELLNKLR